MNYTIRVMSREEVDIAVGWAAEEGWNPGLYDADCFYAADPTGFLVGLLGDQPIATISVVKYGASFAFLGFYIVKPEFRGQGYGLQIWNEGLASLGGRTIGLDGVIAQQDNYRKSGFDLAYRNIRFQCVGGGDCPSQSGLVPLSEIAFDEVVRYDQMFFPDQRTQFLKLWITRPESVALGILSDDQLKGYGVLRRCRSGYKIGPLFADTPEQAELLFLALKSNAEAGAPVFLDIPEVNSAAVEVTRKYQMTPVFETARMYKGPCPVLPLDRLFGVTTFELG